MEKLKWPTLYINLKGCWPNDQIRTMSVRVCYNHCHSCSYRAIIHALILEASVHTTPYVIIIITFHLFVLILNVFS